MRYLMMKILVVLLYVATVVDAKDVVAYQGYINESFYSAKNSIMGGATTATAKGYSALSSNPAGLSSNYNIVVYARTYKGSTNDADGNELNTIDSGDHSVVGALYNSFGVEVKNNDYVLGGGAYGYESDYGLFSVGVSYLYDVTDLTQKDNNPIQTEEFATGNYLTYGVMWQKTFIDLDDFYAIYVGMSHKNSGRYSGDSQNGLIVPLSVSRTNYGMGVETNVGWSSVLVTLDYSKEYWQTFNESLSGLSYGLKWMFTDKFAIAGGYGHKTFSKAIFKETKFAGVGLEFGFWKLHSVVGLTDRWVYDQAGNAVIEQPVVHVDLALAF